MVKFRKFNPLGFTKWSSNLLTKLQIAKTLQLSPPKISCDSTVPDTGTPKSDSSKMVLEVQDIKQNYKTKAIKMSKWSKPQMPLVKRRKKCGKVKKIQTPRMCDTMQFVYTSRTPFHGKQWETPSTYNQKWCHWWCHNSWWCHRSCDTHKQTICGYYKRGHLNVPSEDQMVVLQEALSIDNLKSWSTSQVFWLLI